MAHFAELDSNHIVIRVIVVPDEVEDDGENWCNSLFGGNWKKTSYNAKIRKNYAGIGDTYDASRDAFIPLSPFPSWILNEETCKWEAPKSNPLRGQPHKWDEDTLSWVLQ